MTKLLRSALRAAALATSLAAALFLAASCAAPIKLDASADALAILEPGALAYARLSGAAARDLAPAMIPARELAAMQSLLGRTRVIALGLGALPKADPIAPAAAPTAFQAVLLGDFPFRGSALTLGASPGWKREDFGYYNSKLGLRVGVPAAGLVLASSGPLAPLLASAKSPGPSPIPELLSELAGRELILWVPRPFEGLGSALLGDEMQVPASGLLIAASPAEGMPGLYDASLVFVMDDANSLRIYKSAIKLAWYALAKLLFGDEAEAALARAPSIQGRLFVVSGLTLSRESLGLALGSLRASVAR